MRSPEQLYCTALETVQNELTMRAADVARALSFREFISLCGRIDVKAPSGPLVDIGNRSVRQGGRLREVKFNVVKVKRFSKHVQVLVDHGRGFGQLRWHEVNAQ
jgi:hypothetical protein